MFKIKEYKKEFISDEYPIFSFESSSWDDYGVRCTYYLTYHKSKIEEVDIGEIKILQKGHIHTKLPREFSRLNEEYISLGQDLDFYKNILSVIGTSDSENILEALNDISWMKSKAEDFEKKTEYRNALLRSNGADVALRFGRAVILNEAYDESFSFSYTNNIDGTDNSFDIEIDFDENDELPGRIVGIIGRNAVGKTKLMGNLAKDLVQVRKSAQKTIDDKNERFNGKKPIFNGVITVSYSAFDNFIKPKNPQSSYFYCGIINENRMLSKKSLNENYKLNLSRIIDLDRSKIWILFMSKVLGDKSKEFNRVLEEQIKNIHNIDEKTLSLFSSGQSILAHFVTAIISRIQKNTLILFDEPETHLHPNAVASLFDAFNSILDKYDSFSIVATHSPIVIQEIPKKRVILLTREGDVTLPTFMDFETFGESISELTRHVFDTAEIPNYYKNVLKKLSENKSFEEVNELFESQLGFNAKSYLLSQYGDKK
ncbi:AAA domain-containing protein, putative AbiEii toxin, Type IV TA system [Marinomonas polaris DSM 16579]|uniref:AAA domain-containing protein, putative AbiEii toxin, Type IV TA system n=1 Tax=Marinomonas polaris DSM 16579 TaxID=1122206 RepID=A0A1M5I4Z1_9GAMM|nr:AAA family ATPase [Marinomonas polaris]SHG23010.1 AAA domain-containing protein, putative AbiEii toxin, Type IV TA system [Marinomonas polaris DSM 16579]